MTGSTDLNYSYSFLNVTHADHIVEVTINRPEARNALSSGLMRELIDLARALRLRTDVRAVILTGGDKYFSAGADLGGIRDRLDAPTILETREAIMIGPDLCRSWEEIEAVTIVAIEGFCIGGGCALAVA